MWLQMLTTRDNVATVINMNNAANADCLILTNGVFDPLKAIMAAGSCSCDSCTADVTHTHHAAPAATRKIPCTRCGGRGTMYEYKHVSGGVCFECGGTRFVDAP